MIKGYELEFVKEARQIWDQPPLDSRLIEEEVQKLLKKGAISTVQQCEDQFLSHLFSGAKKDGSQRPVMNLKPLIRFVVRCRLKMEVVHMLRNLLKYGDWMVSVDLKDAYQSVPVTEKHRKYLRLQWEGKFSEF